MSFIDKEKLTFLSFTDLYALHRALKKKGKFNINMEINAEIVEECIDIRIDDLLINEN